MQRKASGPEGRDGTGWGEVAKMPACKGSLSAHPDSEKDSPCKSNPERSLLWYFPSAFMRMTVVILRQNCSVASVMPTLLIGKQTHTLL